MCMKRKMCIKPIHGQTYFVKKLNVIVKRCWNWEHMLATRRVSAKVFYMIGVLFKVPLTPKCFIFLKNLWSFLSCLPSRCFDLVEYWMFRTTLKLDLFLPPPCFWETGTRRVVTSKAERQLSVYIYDSLYPLLTRFSQILNGFCFINVENRSTLKMSSTSSDYDAKCETDGSAFYVTDPLDPSPLQHGHATAWPPNSQLRVVTER